MSAQLKAMQSGIQIDLSKLRRRTAQTDEGGFSLRSVIDNPFEGDDWDEDDNELAVISDWAFRRRNRR